MKNTIHFLVASVAVFMITSCGNSGTVIFEEHKELSPEYEWKKADTRTFTIDIKDNSEPLQLAVAFRYATGYYYDKALMRLTEITPAGTKSMRDIDIVVRDEKGEFIGEKGYDIIDIEFVIDENKKYPAHGTYTYIIEQTMPDVDPLDFAMEVGLVLRKKDKDK